MTTRSVVWCSFTKLSCAWETSNTVVLCLHSDALVAQPDTFCENGLTTIEGTISQVWADGGTCQSSLYHYAVSYDSALLADPTTPLTTADIISIFCKGCLTDWIEEYRGSDVVITENEDTGVQTLVNEHGCLFVINNSAPNVTALNSGIEVVAGSEVGLQLSLDPNNGAFIHEDGLYVQDLTSGWAVANETWTYASPTSFTVPGDVTGKYQKGDKIRVVDAASTKYFYITKIVFSTNTTITITGGSDYTLSGGAISSNYYSHMETPVGFPCSFKYNPTWTGFASNPSNASIRFSIQGNVVSLAANSTPGTSNDTSFQMSLPVTAATITNMQWGAVPWFIEDASSTQTNAGQAVIVSGGTTVILAKTLAGAGGSWTNTGLKGANFTIIYEI